MRNLTIKKSMIQKLAFLLIFLTINYSCQSNLTNEKELMQNTIHAINQRNTKAYTSLFDFDQIRNFWMEINESNDMSSSLSTIIQSDIGEIEKWYSTSYNMVILKIEKIYNLKNYNFSLEEYELIELQKEPKHVRLKFRTLLKDHNGDKWNLDLYITHYKNNYFLSEPIEMNYIQKLTN